MHRSAAIHPTGYEFLNGRTRDILSLNNILNIDRAVNVFHMGSLSEWRLP